MQVLDKPVAPARGIARDELKDRLAEILNRHPAVGLAFGVVRGNELDFFYGHGLASLASRAPITQDTVFRIGSITKTFTAIAVMQLSELGLVDLDAAANDYLLSYRLVPAGSSFSPTTVRHLLTHTGGIPEQARPADVLRPDWGETVPLGSRVPSLAEYYRGKLRVAVQPGTTFMYGDHGFATLGQIVEDVSGLPLERYFRERIFEPLGMADSDLLRSDHVQAGLATGYKVGSHGASAVVDRDLITGPAGAIYSTTRDMARYVAALLGKGSNAHGSVLKPESMAAMFRQQYSPDPRIPGMGLGFFRGDFDGHLTVEHQGILPGFNSQIWAAPNDNVGLIAFTNGSPQAVLWLVTEMAGVLRALLGVPPDRIRTDIPQRPEVWNEVTGWYKPNIPLTDPRSRMFFGAGAEVIAKGGELRFRMLMPIPQLYRGFPLHQDSADDPYVFGVDLSKWGIDKGRLVFSQDSTGRTTSCALDFQPIALQKQPDERNPRIRAARGLALIGAALLIRRLIKRRKPGVGRPGKGGV